MGVDIRLTLTYAFTNFLFLACGAVTLAISIIWNMDAVNNTTTGSVEQNIIFLMTPNMIGIAAGIVTIVAGVSSLPPLAMPTSRGTLHVHAWLVVFASLWLLVLGLIIWTLTLQEQNNIFTAYAHQTAQGSDAIFALQEKYNCCGFFNSTTPPFVISPNACPDAATAANKTGCIVPLQPFADLFLDRLFTTLFGFVGIGTCTVLSGAMLATARSTEARYIRIAEKGYS